MEWLLKRSCVGGECVWWMREGEEGGWKVAYLAVAGEAERRG
jgi:hypothetical protein